MLHTITIPARHYTPFLESAVTLYSASLLAVDPRRRSYEPTTADYLQHLREGRDEQLERAAVLDQIDWSTEPRDVAISAEGDLLRNILSGAIAATADALSGIAEGEVMPFTDLTVYDDGAQQIFGLAALLRTVQHDPDPDPEGGEAEGDG
jgi:hypothetical protein